MKRYYFIALISMLLLSCEDYLDIKPHNKIVPKTTEEYASLIHSFLNDVDYNRDGEVLYNTGTICNYEGFADNLDASLSEGSLGVPLYVGTSLNGMQSDYSKLYSNIKTCNIILGDLEEDSDEAKELKACCYTLRAICYYNLIRIFCEPYEKGNAENQLGVSIVKDFSLEARPLREDLKSSAEFIESDLKKAISYNLVNDALKLDVDVAKAYLARLYYWTKNWEKAIDVSQELLNNYPLISGDEYVNMINSIKTKTGNELFKSYSSIDNGTEKNYHDVFSNVRTRPASKGFVELFEDGDIRYALSLDSKRKNLKPILSRIRTAEFCLIIAESYACLKKDEKALEYLNLLRSNRIRNYRELRLQDLMPPTDDYLIKTDAEGNELTPLMYAIITERQKEMYMEGDRWFQLKMHGRPEFWIGYDGLKYTTREYMYTAPISKTDCQLISGLKQNPGYID